MKDEQNKVIPTIKKNNPDSNISKLAKILTNPNIAKIIEETRITMNRDNFIMKSFAELTILPKTFSDILSTILFPIEFKSSIIIFTPLY